VESVHTVLESVQTVVESALLSPSLNTPPYNGHLIGRGAL
jgi:hypothetical protein